MGKFIFENLSELSDVDALKCVGAVIAEGLVSTETIQGERVAKYCHVTTFTNPVTGSKCVVYTRPRKSKNSASSFVVLPHGVINNE
jgi:hypothetical protein